MNSSSFIDPSVLAQNSTMTIIESWYIPVDIIRLVFCILMLIATSFLLLILILDKTCHTVPMMLIANTYFSGFISGCILLSLAIVTLQNDLEQIQYQDSLCVFRAYIVYSAAAAFYYSFVLQALYRYLIVIYPTRLFFQSFRFHLLIICSSWVFCSVYPLACLLDGQFIYSVENQVCLVPLSFSFATIYMACCLFSCPVSFIMSIYWNLVRHVREMGKNVTGTNNLIRAQRELKMVRRIVILITVLIILCTPLTIFVFMGFFNQAPKYHGRISFLFDNFSGLTVMVILVEFTDPLKEAVMKRIKWRPNRIVAWVT